MDENKFNELLKEKSVQRSGANYIYIVDGVKTTLGRSKVEAIEALGNILDPDGASRQANAPTVSKAGNPVKDNPTGFEELLGMIEDIDPSQEGAQDLDIFINGVDSRLNDHPVIKAFPLSLRWRTKAQNVDSGSGLVKNQGYTVLRKDYPGLKNKDGQYVIKVSRDDSPNLNHWSVNDLVLCAMKKTQYEDRIKRDEAKVMLHDKVEQEQRNNFAKEMSKVSDVSQVVSQYTGINQMGRAAHVEQSALKGISATQANAMLDNLTGEQAVELASKL